MQIFTKQWIEYQFNSVVLASTAIAKESLFGNTIAKESLFGNTMAKLSVNGTLSVAASRVPPGALRFRKRSVVFRRDCNYYGGLQMILHSQTNNMID